MKRLLLTLMLPVALLAQAGADRAPLLETLRQDLETARANANLSERQQADLQAAMNTLKQARETRMNGGTPDRRGVQNALKTIRDISQSDAFRAEDKEKIRKDIEAIRESAGQRGGRGRRRF